MSRFMYCVPTLIRPNKAAFPDKLQWHIDLFVLITAGINSLAFHQVPLNRYYLTIKLIGLFTFQYPLFYLFIHLLSI